MTVLQWFAYVGAIATGVVCHELAHWVVWAVTGRQPVFGLTSVRPRAGPPRTLPSDRMAAAAPYALGAVAILIGGYHTSILWFGLGLGLIKIPSKSDIEAMRGRVKWNIDGE